jgi:two-component system alkaline phosphatase synthesis response regulator PhoP
MPQRLFIIAQQALSSKLVPELDRAGFMCYTALLSEGIGRLNADLVLIEMDGGKAAELCRQLKLEYHLPVIALVKTTGINGALLSLPCDDFIVEPFQLPELSARISRQLSRAARPVGQIKAGDLVIDPTQAEVYLSGQSLELTFREYELLRFLVEHPGRVFSRDELLKAVWGYDYFGGDRTVDVHIRRLRSKIEDAEHSFIDTLRNMGYRFKKQE